MTNKDIKNKTKVIATIGPASWDVEMLVKLAQNGMAIARINFSHGDTESLEHIVVNIREAEKISGKKIEILQDLSGPKIRTGDFENGEIELKEGVEMKIFEKEILGNEKEFSISYPSLFRDLKVGGRIFLNDGKQELEILENTEDFLKVKVIVGGKMKSKRGVNFPDSDLIVSALTEKDIQDLKFAEKYQPEYIALSFVKTAQSIEKLRQILQEREITAKIISKIETKLAVKNIDEIIEASDLVMVARGDLAVEVGFEKVPQIKKDIIDKCNEKEVPEIVATQVLESMINSSVPTRAEVSDIDVAVSRGADFIMLSAETATGKYPLEALKTMVKIIKETEKNL